MKIFDLKNYGIDDLSKESFEIRKIIINKNDYHYDENNKIQCKIISFKRYIIVDKKTNEEIRINDRCKAYKKFKKALLTILRFQERIIEDRHKKCENFYNYKQDKESFDEYYKNNYWQFDEFINPECFLNYLKECKGHMSDAIKKYINLIEDGDFYNENDYIAELIYNQIPHRYYQNAYFIKHIPKYAKLMSKEFLYTKKGEKFYGEKITDNLKKGFKINEKYYKELMYDMVKECKENKKNNNKDFYKNLYKKIIESE